MYVFGVDRVSRAVSSGVGNSRSSARETRCREFPRLVPTAAARRKKETDGTPDHMGETSARVRVTKKQAGATARAP